MKHLFTSFIVLLMMLVAVPAGAQRKFRHPGLSVNQADIDRMKAMYNAKEEPFYTGFKYLAGDNNWTTRYRDITRDFVTAKNSKTGEQEPVIYANSNLWLETFGKVAFNNALVWLITGDTYYADRAVTVLNRYAKVHHTIPWGTNPLDNSKAYSLIEAAELMRDYPGWKAEDQQGFRDFLTYPAYSTKVNHYEQEMAKRIQGDSCSTNLTIYWNVFQGDFQRHGNQGLYAIRTLLAMGVYLDNDTIYDRAYNKLLSRPCRKDDIPFPKGPCKRGKYDTNKNLEYNESYYSDGEGDILDYGSNDELQYWIYENGQSQESSRDQGHILDCMHNMSHIGRIMWNQGDDFLTQFDNRVLKGFEYTAKYCYSWINNHEKNEMYWQNEPDFEPTVENGQFMDCWARNNLYHSIKINPWRENLSEKDQWGRSKRAKYPLSMYMQYKVRLDTPADQMVWLQRALDMDRDSLVNIEKADENALFNDLLYYRTSWMAGDGVKGFDAYKQPVYGLIAMPGTIKAANYDSYPDSLDGNGHTYYSGNGCSTVPPLNQPENDYRAEGGLQLAKVGNDYAVTSLSDGAWINYSFQAAKTQTMLVSINAEITKRVTVGVSVDNSPTVKTTIAPTSGYQTCEIGKVSVPAGARVLRLFIEGASEAISIKDIVMEASTADASIVPYVWNSRDYNATTGTILADQSSENLYSTSYGNSINANITITTTGKLYRVGTNTKYLIIRGRNINSASEKAAIYRTTETGSDVTKTLTTAAVQHIKKTLDDGSVILVWKNDSANTKVGRNTKYNSVLLGAYTGAKDNFILRSLTLNIFAVNSHLNTNVDAIEFLSPEEAIEKYPCLSNDVPTGVSEVRSEFGNNNKEMGGLYNAAGQRVGKNYKGMVIANGKVMLQ